MSDDYSDFLVQEPETSFGTRLMERCKAQPFLMAGWAGTFGALIYGAYRYKTKGPSMTPSVFVLQLRVFAQGAIVASLTLGMIYEAYRTHINKKDKKIKD